MVRIFDRSGPRVHYLVYRHFLARMQIVAMGVAFRGNDWRLLHAEAV